MSPAVGFSPRHLAFVFTTPPPVPTIPPFVSEPVLAFRRPGFLDSCGRNLLVCALGTVPVPAPTAIPVAKPIPPTILWAFPVAKPRIILRRWRRPGLARRLAPGPLRFPSLPAFFPTALPLGGFLLEPLSPLLRLLCRQQLAQLIRDPFTVHQR
jgi:hypothetical protein